MNEHHSDMYFIPDSLVLTVDANSLYPLKSQNVYENLLTSRSRQLTVLPTHSVAWLSDIRARVAKSLFRKQRTQIGKNIQIAHHERDSHPGQRSVQPLRSNAYSVQFSRPRIEGRTAPTRLLLVNTVGPQYEKKVTCFIFFQLY